MSRSKISVIIAAAGSSRRMGGGLPKQYRMCENLPVLVRAVRVFRACPDISEIVVSVPRGDTEYCRELLGRYGLTDLIISEGGAERMDSVYAALNLVSADSDLVLVHDGARPFVTEDVINRVIEGLKVSEAVIPCVPPKNTIRTADRTLDRSMLYEVQTPQGFRADTLRRAYDAAMAEGFKGTDEASLTEHIGAKTAIVEGDYRNIKITTAEDLPLITRTGIGYDVHRLTAGRPLMLGCIEVPFDRGLLGHSDADVLSHAIADALLGAAAMGDIGKHFPDNDPSCEGMSGRELLSRTASLLAGRGFTITCIDATLVAEKPKVSKLTDAMCAAVAEALGIEKEAVSVKATTEEGLGISGGGDAMAAYAVANVTSR